MSGHNKFSKIKHKKAASDAKKSKIFTRISKIITMESKKAGGDTSSPGLATAIETAKKENMPKDTIERAIKKGLDKDSADLEPVTYETYGPGGSAIIIEALTDNKNRTAAEIRHTLSGLGSELAAPGSATWAFGKEGTSWVPDPNTVVPLGNDDKEKLRRITETLEENEDVQGVFVNVLEI